MDVTNSFSVSKIVLSKPKVDSMIFALKPKEIKNYNQKYGKFRKK